MADAPKKSSASAKSTAHLLNIKKPSEVKKRLKLSFQRVPAKLRLVKAGEELSISLALVDISEGGAGFFLSQMINKGTLVEFQVTDPQPITVKGLVAWCVPMNSGMHVLKHPFRAGVQFVFDAEADRTKMAEFVKKILFDTSVHWPTGAVAPSGAPEAPVIPIGAPAAAAPPVEAAVPATPEATPTAAPAAEAPAAPAAAEDPNKKAA